MVVHHSFNHLEGVFCIWGRHHAVLMMLQREYRILYISRSFNPHLPFFQLRRPGELVDRRSTAPVLVPGLALVFERRVRHVAGPLLNSHRCGPSAPPWAPIYRCPHSLTASEAFAVQTLCMGFHLVDPPLSALAALPESLLHGCPCLLSPLIIPPLFAGSPSIAMGAPLFRKYATKHERKHQ